MTMLGLASSAKLTATFTCPEASTIINAICTGMLLESLTNFWVMMFCVAL